MTQICGGCSLSMQQQQYFSKIANWTWNFGGPYSWQVCCQKSYYVILNIIKIYKKKGVRPNEIFDTSI